MTKRKRTRQNNTQKTNTCATITQLKTEGELMCSGSVHSSYLTCGTLRVTFVLPDSILVFSEENICVITHY